LLTFALRCREAIDSDFGPVITSAIRFADQADGTGANGRGFYVEDAGYPSFVSWLLQAADEPRALWLWRKTLFHIVRKWLQRRPQTDVSGPVSAFFGDSKLSAGLLPLLGMGRGLVGPRLRRPGPARRRRLGNAGPRGRESESDDRRGGRSLLRRDDRRKKQLMERVVPFRSRDGFEANLVNVRANDRPEKGPILLVHGAGVRANIFRAPSGENLVDVLVAAGYD